MPTLVLSQDTIELSLMRTVWPNEFLLLHACGDGAAYGCRRTCRSPRTGHGRERVAGLSLLKGRPIEPSAGITLDVAPSVAAARGASWMALDSMEDHHGNIRQCHASRAVEQGRIVGQKAPFKLKDIWALRVRLQMNRRVRELALFNLGIDSTHGQAKDTYR